MLAVRGLALLLLGLAAFPASAQRIVASPGPEAVAVTVYRDPARGADQAPNLQWLNGYALVSETRRVTLPPGESTIRFEGVAGGILPQSAIVTGFPEGIVERNRDAYLLSPATLLDRSLGRRVHIRRTSAATGAVRELEAVIRSGAGGAVVLETAAGFEALRCTGLAETPIYDDVPAELSATPTLSVRVRSQQRLTATVTLSYIASGFDWQANYVAQLSADGRRAELFAWLTLASTDETSFRDAHTQAVAGRLNRDPVPLQPREGGPLVLQCWPQATTSDIPLEQWLRAPPARPLPPPAEGDMVVVTGSRIPNRQFDVHVTGRRGLRRAGGAGRPQALPHPATGHGRVAQPEAGRAAAAAGRGGRDRLSASGSARCGAHARIRSNGCSSPATAPRRGSASRFPPAAWSCSPRRPDRPLVLGEGYIDDRAVGEDVEISLGEGTGVFDRGRGWRRRTTAVTISARRHQRPRRPVRFRGGIRHHRRRRGPGPASPCLARRAAVMVGDGAGQRHRDFALPGRARLSGGR